MFYFIQFFIWRYDFKNGKYWFWKFLLALLSSVRLSLHSFSAVQYSVSPHFCRQVFGFWQILDPPGRISLQIFLDIDNKQSEFMEQNAINKKFIKLRGENLLLPGLWHLSLDVQYESSEHEQPDGAWQVVSPSFSCLQILLPAIVEQSEFVPQVTI